MSRAKGQDLAPACRALLDSGQAATATLAECLAVDFAALLRAAVPEAGEAAAQALDAAAAQGITRRMALAAALLLRQPGPQGLPGWANHPSDTVRGWACFVAGAQPGLALHERLATLQPLADDAHFGVREWAWLAVRPHIAGDLDTAIGLLAQWARHPSERVRRFASEALRPRGVWCTHLGPLKQTPQRALPVLEPLRADPSAYVQDSVGNWLNDAAKDQPGWVRALCADWLAASPTSATRRICTRAQRSISP
ncbi:DNA alkylation repair protein [Paenacidovorax monticola]|uniref:DNA alkylation repair protein n=1 Tax=Paenacidovorax monticola TaxID=1926868 RepID=A0A7H0HBX9_9BURK|nr:DNA alkylation repair protein [Paenacidovorax monticola]QNP58045.1 DNA alkylation repair protein [Paenacidovorax monticola]